MAELSPYALRLALYLVLMLLFGRMLFVRPGCHAASRWRSP
ncbi:hypothetical protein [Stenotrophomonas maltophilia]|nr:hypothetical protein [Stenotrophomonas maltophilia]GFF05792.1 hypothetical protein SM139_0943 [Stenotrophomonas maltophilia]